MARKQQQACHQFVERTPCRELRKGLECSSDGGTVRLVAALLSAKMVHQAARSRLWILSPRTVRRRRGHASIAERSLSAIVLVSHQVSFELQPTTQLSDGSSQLATLRTVGLFAADALEIKLAQTSHPPGLYQRPSLSPFRLYLGIKFIEIQHSNQNKSHEFNWC